MNMRRRFFGLVLSLYALLLAACQPGVAIPSAAGVTCLTNFEATVQHGPSAGLAVTGKLLFTLDHSGELIGGVATTDGSDIPVTGQVNGRAINLSFNLGQQKFLFGVGSAENPIESCTGYWGGGFTGPEPGDSGDWLASDGSDISQESIELSLDPNTISELTVVENSASGEITVSTTGDAGQTYDFVCSGQNSICTCKGTPDCTRLAETRLCRARITFNRDGSGFCPIRIRQQE